MIAFLSAAGRLGLGDPVVVVAPFMEQVTSWWKVNSLPTSVPLKLASSCRSIHQSHRRQAHKLLTLARDGTLLATYTDPALWWPRGQVLVCGHMSFTVLQLATLATERHGHHIIHHCGTEVERQHPGVQSEIDKDAEDVVDKDDLNTQKIKTSAASEKIPVSVQGLNAWTKCMCVKCGTKCMCVKCGTKCMCVKCGTKYMCSVQGLNAWTKCILYRDLMHSVQGLNAWTKCMCVKCGTKCMCVKCGTKCMCVKCGTKCMCVKCGTKCMCVKCGTKCMCVKCGTKCMCVKCGTKCMCVKCGSLTFCQRVVQDDTRVAYSISQYLNCPSVSQVAYSS
ncbi:hypothetical protein DPMN_003016 [Dreissena polymorpha]|uniref:Uncharacterized protein n=1 Tax=Dreissena polymorpha TaxID=45954 RepID=A0A9D4MN29_DREPO|nr:hypothetical protein DPMN_003016 [Dreissena polymorpha]